MLEMPLATAVIFIFSPTILLIGSGIGLYNGCISGILNRTARLLSYTGTYISLWSAFRCAWQSVQFPARKRIAIFKMVSPAGTPKKVRILLMVYDHLLVPAAVARAAASVEPHVNFE